MPFQVLFFSAKRWSLSNATLSTDCATLYQYQATLSAAVNQAGPGYLWVESYSSPDGAVLVSRVNVTCSAPVAVPSSDGELVVPVTNAMQFLNGLAYISRYSSSKGCTTLELTQNVSLASAHWPGMVAMEPSFTIRAVNGTWTILDLGERPACACGSHVWHGPRRAGWLCAHRQCMLLGTRPHPLACLLMQAAISIRCF